MTSPLPFPFKATLYQHLFLSEPYLLWLPLKESNKEKSPSLNHTMLLGLDTEDIWQGCNYCDFAICFYE
jgi:hypothetical protein